MAGRFKSLMAHTGLSAAASLSRASAGPIYHRSETGYAEEMRYGLSHTLVVLDYEYGLRTPPQCHRGFSCKAGPY
jgi:hypothetical protein